MTRPMTLAMLLVVASILTGGGGAVISSEPPRSGPATPGGAATHALNLSASGQLDPVYHGAARGLAAMKQGRMPAQAVAAADFDEDGMPDLLVAHKGPFGAGALALHRGNVDAIYPNQPDARQRRANGSLTDAPFLRDVSVFDAAGAVDLIGAGDFDADGHWDAVTARRGARGLFWHKGDGKGSLGPAKKIDIPGRITALVVGDVNRRDGLDDVVVAVDGPRGARLVVFEGPRGALVDPPEEISVAGPVSTIALGQVDDDSAIDLVVAADSNLQVIHGRDRRLSLDAARRAAVSPASLTTISLPFIVQSLAVGELDDNPGPDIALLDASRRLSMVGARELLEDPRSVVDGLSPVTIDSPTGAAGGTPEAMRLVRAKVSTQRDDDLLLLDAGASGVLTRRPVDPRGPGHVAVAHALGDVRDVVGMRLGPEALDSLVQTMDGVAAAAISRPTPLDISSVTNTNDSGPGSLRQAILDANADPGLTTISFDIPGPAPHTIQPASTLPEVTAPVVIDATTQPDYAGSPVVSLDGAPSGLQIGLRLSGGSSTIRGLAISGYSYSATDGGAQIWISTTGDNIVEGNFLGTDTTGTVGGLGNGVGAYIASRNNRVGGTTAAARNIFSGIPDGSAMEIDGRFLFGPGADGTTVLGNYIGLDPTGSISLPNGNGIYLYTTANVTIGGTTAGARNVISGPNYSLILAEGTTDSLVQGNYFGTNSAGTATLGALDGGVAFWRGHANTLGGTTPAARNVLCGHRVFGIGFESSPGSVPTGDLIQGNYVGVGADGITALPNFNGVYIQGGPNNIVGGFTASARNIISGNNGSGVKIDRGVGDNDVLGNWIGTDSTGSLAVPNYHGVHITDSTLNRIGGATLEAANLISGNSHDGVLIDGSTASANVVEVNLIGTDATGTLPLGNGLNGVELIEAPSNFVGIKQGQGNTIAAGAGAGVVLNGASARFNRIQGNRIGTNVTGTSALGNLGQGVMIIGGASDNIIGGHEGETGNLISGNFLGIRVVDGSNNQVLGNLIGTDLSGTAALPNGAGIEVEAPGNQIGNGSLVDRNVISGNLGEGVTLMSFDVVLGNFIGTTADGTGALGNGGSGILIDAGTPTGGAFNEVGLAALPEGGNSIAYNGGAGITVAPGSLGNHFSGNSIHDNAGLGIDLGGDGITFNDTDDPDVGANNLENYPVLTTVTTTGARVNVRGSLDSAPLTSFALDVFVSPSCDSSGFGEGQIYLGTTSATTGAGSADAAFVAAVPGSVDAGEAITITATSPDHNTSEFSACFSAVGVPTPVVTALSLKSGPPESVSWDAVPGAIQYHVYVGTGATLHALASQQADSCETLVVKSPGFTIPPAGNPPVGQVFWIDVTSEGPYGEGPVGPGDPGARILNSTGVCGDSCSHDPCTVGGALIPACAPCSSIVCDKDPDCCAVNGAWTATCVKEMRTVCGTLLCPEAQGQCAHSVCDAAQSLSPGCDSPPLAVSCTAAICQVDPHCCQQAWDQACIAKVASVCHQSCL